MESLRTDVECFHSWCLDLIDTDLRVRRSILNMLGVGFPRRHRPRPGCAPGAALTGAIYGDGPRVSEVADLKVSDVISKVSGSRPPRSRGVRRGHDAGP